MKSIKREAFAAEIKMLIVIIVLSSRQENQEAGKLLKAHRGRAVGLKDTLPLAAPSIYQTSDPTHPPSVEGQLQHSGRETVCSLKTGFGSGLPTN